MSGDNAVEADVDWIKLSPTAFPDGLTKRERFAMAALQGLLANPGPHIGIASIAVQYADRLLEELDKEAGE